MKNEIPDGGQYITKTEMAVRMQVTTRTIDSWMVKGLVPFRKIGRTVRFSWSEVQDQLNAHGRSQASNPDRKPANGIAGLLRQRAAEIRKSEAQRHDPP